MPESSFTYNITRPYPFRWFTPVTIVGGVILIVLLSFMNFVNSSYILEVQDVQNPNATISNGVWFRNWPSYLTRSAQPTCQPNDLPINTQFFTNQTALQYTLTSVADISRNARSMSPSLPYLNNVLENCNISQIQMAFDSLDDQSFIQYQNVSFGITVRAFATCRMWTPTGRTEIELTAVYDPVPEFPSPGSSTFITRDPLKRASLYWAELLLSAEWEGTSSTLSNMSTGINDWWLTKGYVSLYPNEDQNRIMALDFFKMKYAFQRVNMTTSIEGDNLWGGTNGPYDDLQTVEYFIANKYEPHAWVQIDRLAKSMYSAVASDLGQVSTSGVSNYVTNPALLQNLSSQFLQIQEKPTGSANWYADNIQTEDYNSLKNITGPLGLTPSVIATKYLCQIPKLKSGGEIFISILLADLVLISAAWQLFIFAVGFLVLKKEPNANYCEGCSKSMVGKGEEIKQTAKYVSVASFDTDERRTSHSSPNPDA